MAGIDWTVAGVGPRIVEFLDPLIEAGDLDLEYVVFASERIEKPIGPEITVDFDGRDSGLLLRRRAELLLALEHLTLEALRVPHEERHRLMFDVDQYRMLRIDELCRNIASAAARVAHTGQRFAFRPMTSRERRIVHVMLNDDERVTTVSEGMPPNRYPVIEVRVDEES